MIRLSFSWFLFLTLFICLAARSVPAQTNPASDGAMSSSTKSQGTKAPNSAALLPPGSDTAGDKSVTPKRPDKVSRDNAQRYYKSGLKYERANLYRQAVQSFEQAIKDDPEFADAYYALGQANMALGRYSEAVAAFEKLVKINPQAIGGYAVLGQAYSKLREEASKTGNNSALAESSSSPVTSTSDATGDLTRIYRVGVGDVLDVHVSGSASDESTLFTVSSNGQVDHPLLGRGVNVLGLTTQQISELIGAELKRRSIRDGSNPEVAVRDYNSHTILVSGLVKEPGTKILRREAIPLYVVLADAQPLPEAYQVSVMSQQASESKTIELSNSQETALLIRPGDVVTVQPQLKQFFYIGGEVKSPGELPFRRGLSLTQAILTAGGVTAKGDKVQLTRGNGNGLLTMQEFKLKDINKGKTPDPLVEPGDRITVLP